MAEGGIRHLVRLSPRQLPLDGSSLTRVQASPWVVFAVKSRVCIYRVIGQLLHMRHFQNCSDNVVFFVPTKHGTWNLVIHTSLLSKTLAFLIKSARCYYKKRPRQNFLTSAFKKISAFRTQHFSPHWVFAYFLPRVFYFELVIPVLFVNRERPVLWWMQVSSTCPNSSLP